MTEDGSLEPDGSEPVVGFQAKKLRDVQPRHLAIRFAFGAAVSVVASVCGVVFSPVVGGMFLAFPAILPASLTLLEEKEGTKAAVEDVGGAVLGSVGLVAFAVLAAVLFTLTFDALVFASATAGWVVLSIGLYLIGALLRRRARVGSVRGLSSNP